LICCALDGEVRGYLPGEAEAIASMLDTKPDDKILKDLSEEKAKLELELRNLENSLKSAKCVGGLQPL
jgi:Bardet-Biedl syndrome 2 protein